MSESIKYKGDIVSGERYLYFEETYGKNFLYRMDAKDRAIFIDLFIKHVIITIKQIHRFNPDLIKLHIDQLNKIEVKTNKSLCDNAYIDLCADVLSICKNPAPYTIYHEFTHLIHYHDMFGFGKYDDGSCKIFEYHGRMFEKYLKKISSIVRRRKDFKIWHNDVYLKDRYGKKNS